MLSLKESLRLGLRFSLRFFAEPQSDGVNGPAHEASTLDRIEHEQRAGQQHLVISASSVSVPTRSSLASGANNGSGRLAIGLTSAALPRGTVTHSGSETPSLVEVDLALPDLRLNNCSVGPIKQFDRLKILESPVEQLEAFLGTGRHAVGAYQHRDDTSIAALGGRNQGSSLRRPCGRSSCRRPKDRPRAGDCGWTA